MSSNTRSGSLSHGSAPTIEARDAGGIASSSPDAHGNAVWQDPTDNESNHATTVRQKLQEFCERNLGLLFVFVAQMFASIMSMTTRLLETGFEPKFHALQVIFVRMLTTALIGSAWMWYKNIPDFPLGPRGVRRLLIIRGTAGSMGLFGLYYSLSYLNVSDATVITFLVPTITAFVCWIALSEPYTSREAVAGIIALIGVLCIAQPHFLFSLVHKTQSTAHEAQGDFTTFRGENATVKDGGILPPVEASPLERSIAVVCAILGAFSAATAYATIRVIGKRAHSLVSVNYFAMLATISSFLIILIHPDLRFEIPMTPLQWGLLATIGLSGFLLQILLTEGLQREKAGRATNLIYTQLLFSLIIDYFVWGSVPSLSSVLGGLLIICAAVWVSLQTKAHQVAPAGGPDERSSLLGNGGQATRV